MLFCLLFSLIRLLALACCQIEIRKSMTQCAHLHRCVSQCSSLLVLLSIHKAETDILLYVGAEKPADRCLLFFTRNCEFFLNETPVVNKRL